MNNVLYIGPDYRNHRGGIGAVLDVYATHIKPFRFISTYSTGSFLLRLLVYIRALFVLPYILLSDRNIKIVHIHTASRGSFMRKSVLVMIGKLFRKKVVLHVHGAEFHIFYKNAGLLRPYIRFILGKTDVLVSLSEKWKSYFASNFKVRRLTVINNVIEQADPAVEIKRNGRVNFLFLGSIGQRKGVFDLLQVLHQNRDAFKDRFTLTVGGNGEVERLKQTISSNHTHGEVSYAGWVNGSRKRELLNQCDVYVLPSYNEGLPISVLEAMAYGKPVISTNVGGIPEIVRPGFNGWLFEPGDHQALKLIIGEVLDNRELLKEYGENSLSLSMSYTPESVFSSLDALYKQLINE